VRIESDAEKDLALSAEDAENVVGGKETRKKSAKQTTKVALIDPLVVKQIDTGPGEVSENSGNSVPDPSDPFPSS
jgi:hypothetical protein